MLSQCNICKSRDTCQDIAEKIKKKCRNFWPQKKFVRGRAKRI